MPTRGDSTSTASADDIVPVTPDDAGDANGFDANGPFRGFMITADGTLKITTMAGNDRTFAAGELATGVIHSIRIRRVWSTGTSATVWGAT